MAAPTTTPAAGLEGVIAGESEICCIDGYAGILSYCGYNIHTLAENATFEEVVFLLWNRRLPTQPELDELDRTLVEYRDIPAPVTAFLAQVPLAAPMDVLRTAVSMLSAYDAEANDNSPQANRRKAAKLIAKTATVVSTFDRIRRGREVLPGDPGLGLAANLLYTLTGKRPDDVMERALDVGLILHADHELNASTFAARVTAATLSDMYSAVTSAIGTLKGPLHGGANEEVIRLLLEVKDPETGAQRVRDMLARKVKIPGFGHRVYRTEDPRATHLRALSEKLGRRTGHLDLYLISKRIEETVKQEKKLNPNVDFYSASAYYSLGIPVDLYTPIFAISRMAGYTAHILEQYENNRLIRPRAEYKGHADGRAWIPRDQR